VHFTVDNGISDFGDARVPGHRSCASLPVLLTVDEAAALLRTTRRAIRACTSFDTRSVLTWR
jgi:hypothetical protein